MKMSKYNIITEAINKHDFIVYNILNKRLIRIPNKGLINQQWFKEKYMDFFDDGSENIKKRYLFDSMKYQTTRLNITLMMTMSCNFRCIYCFENDVRMHDFGVLDTEFVINWIINMLKKYKIKQLDLCFHGGEPLLEFDKIVLIANNLKKYCIINNLSYLFTIVSNGFLLTNNRSSVLKRAGISIIQITLDGSKEAHDKRRFLKNGLGTFETIVNNIIQSSDLKIYINVVYDLSNYKEVFNLIDFLNELKLHNTIGMIMINATKPILKDKRLNEWRSPEDFQAKTKIALLDYILEKGFKIPFELNYQMCTIKQKNSFIYLPNKSIYKCISGAGMKEFFICNLKSETDDPVEKQYKFLYNELNEKCDDCKYMPICNGSCYYEYNLYKCDSNIICKKKYLDIYLPLYLNLMEKYNFSNEKMVFNNENEMY